MVKDLKDGFVSKESYDLEVGTLKTEVNSLQKNLGWVVRTIIGAIILSVLGLVITNV